MNFNELQKLAQTDTTKFTNELIEKLRSSLGEKSLNESQVSTIQEPIEALRKLITLGGLTENEYAEVERGQIQAMIITLRTNLHKARNEIELADSAPPAIATRVITLDAGPTSRSAPISPPPQQQMRSTPPVAPIAPPAAELSGAQTTSATRAATALPSSGKVAAASVAVALPSAIQGGRSCPSASCNCGCCSPVANALHSAATSVANVFSFFCCGVPQAIGSCIVNTAQRAAAPVGRCICGSAACLGSCVAVTAVGAVTCVGATAAAVCTCAGAGCVLCVGGCFALAGGRR